MSLFSGLCLGVMVGGATAASAADHAQAAKPSASAAASASNSSSSGASAGAGEEKSTQPASKPAKPKPASPQVEKPAPAKPEKAQPAKPDKPAKAEPAEPDTPEPVSAEAHEPAQPETGTGSQPEHAQSGSATSHGKAVSDDERAAPAKAASNHTPQAVAHGQPTTADPAPAGKPVVRYSVGTNGTPTADDDAQPRAPDAGEAPDVDPPVGPTPAAPAPCPPPASSMTAAGTASIGGLRNAHAILPCTPDLSDTATVLVAQRDIGPDLSIRSVETTASPD
ncbi:hypothetical protein EIL87_26040 [Saccharopolyspora rhizosphaerae]|uniref:Uncharacterized protein n=1 Tax=Saccharopolyspora rhizosphaerae TaxID=2492662 RepID=A0A3R8NTT8_9PSEU|nr:hypothetical protein [Saccharopolyspora rhizosphaerae]RRO13108.1 hypothetical protein EIL87_26040 [Saccharopolyspora rhizosphaerae]